MSSSTPEVRAAVLTVSDSCSRGEKPDASGPAVANALERHQFKLLRRDIVPDETAVIQKKLIELCAEARLVVTTGGTGIAPRDVTPEATRAGVVLVARAPSDAMHDFFWGGLNPNQTESTQMTAKDTSNRRLATVLHVHCCLFP